MEDKSFFTSRIFFLMVIILIIVISSSVYLINKGLRKRSNLILLQKEKKILSLKKKQEKEKRRRKIDTLFKDIQLKAESVLVEDLANDEIIFTKNKKKKQSIASLTKIMTALIALDDNNLNQVVIHKKDLYPEGEYFLKAGERFSKEDIISFMLVASSNDAARAISNSLITDHQLFLEKMNDRALSLGLDSTFFFSDTGLDVANSVGGSYSTTEDINTLIKYFYRNYPKISEKMSKESLDVCSDLICHQIKNTDEILSSRPEIVFSKTGYTNFSGGSIAVIAKIYGKLYSIIILNSTKSGRFEDLNKIIDILLSLGND